MGASEFPRIDPDDPLARAAREVNEHAETAGLEDTFALLGFTASPGQVAYLAEQRALRAVAAVTMGLPDVDETVARAIVRTPLWRDMRMLLVGVFMDGLAIGARASQLEGDGDE